MKKNKDLNYYLSLPYKINIIRLEDGDYFAQFENKALKRKVLMCGTGKSADEAINDLKTSFACYVEDALEKGEFIPEDNQKDKSKNIAVTLKNSLIDEIDYYAKELGISRSAFLAMSAKNYMRSLI